MRVSTVLRLEEKIMAESEYIDKIMKIFLSNKKEDNCEICIICGHKIHYDTETYYDINGAAVCDGCMFTVCEIKPIKDGDINE